MVAIGVLATALLIRSLSGQLAGANPSLVFYPVVLISAVVLGWVEALLVLLLSIGAGAWLFLPRGLYLLPLAWLFVGSFTIAIVCTLMNVAAELAATNERQKILFRELQHRVANTLQAANGTLAIIKRWVRNDPAEATRLIDEAIQRFSASADIHRRLHDPSLFHRNLASILTDAVATVIDVQAVTLTIDVEPLELNFDQSSIVTMLVIEVANNAQKHVFRHRPSGRFLVRLREGIAHEAILTIKDDGQGWSRLETTDRSLGLGIVHALAEQLGGRIAIQSHAGTETVVRFPIRPPRLGAGPAAAA